MSATLVVQKYGGSSLGTPERILQVAHRIADRAARGSRIVVTVSAMGDSTDDLIELARRITPDPPRRELDMLLSVGERISMSLLSMALNDRGCHAISFTGSQSGIVTSVRHTRAMIEEIKADRIREALADEKVVIVAGFQGVSRTREITTLGRGGSDTTAVAIAASLRAATCEIYSDFPGIFTADPRSVPGARPISQITYDDMLELAARGARVLHYRAAEIARRYRVPLRLLSSFKDGEGTLVAENSNVESVNATSITCNTDIALLTVRQPCGTLRLAELLQRFSASDIPLFAYHRESDGAQDVLCLVVPREDVSAVQEAAARLAPVDVVVREDVATVSLVGSGLSCSAHVMARVEEVIGETQIPVFLVDTSALSITCVVPESGAQNVVSALHQSFFEIP